MVDRIGLPGELPLVEAEYRFVHIEEGEENTISSVRNELKTTLTPF
jgi:hypothetical protein